MLLYIVLQLRKRVCTTVYKRFNSSIRNSEDDPTLHRCNCYANSLLSCRQTTITPTVLYSGPHAIGCNSFCLHISATDYETSRSPSWQSYNWCAQYYNNNNSIKSYCSPNTALQLVWRLIWSALGPQSSCSRVADQPTARFCSLKQSAIKRSRSAALVGALDFLLHQHNVIWTRFGSHNLFEWFFCRTSSWGKRHQLRSDHFVGHLWLGGQCASCRLRQPVQASASSTARNPLEF